MNETQRPWHRLFGLSLVDFFRGMPVTVELEKDLSLKQQMLDVVLIHKGAAPLLCRLPDGFEEPAPHNLITFKSFQEALDGWARTNSSATTSITESRRVFRCRTCSRRQTFAYSR